MNSRWPRVRFKTSRGDGFYTFLSYSSRDDEIRAIKPFIDRYIDEMRSRVGRYAPIYYDYFYLPNGHCRLDEKLADAISDSDFTTAFLSPGYAASPWCAFEWGYASGLSRAAGERVHAVLPILWKQPVEIRSGWRAIDIVRSIERKKYDEALEVAVQETLEFLDRRYG